MQYYGKINENNELEYAPTNYGNILNFDKNEKLLKEYGYKPVIDTLRPSYDDFYYTASSKWVENEDEIVKEWEIKPKDEAEVQEQINTLYIRRGDVFEALILAKGIGKQQIRTMIENADTIDNVTKALYLNRFDEAIDFYRGYPIFNMLGDMLGITNKQLNDFFITKDYKYLTNPKLTITSVPENATVIINGIEQNEIVVPYSTPVEFTVACEGYKDYKETLTLFGNVEKTVELEIDKTNIIESEIYENIGENI